MKLLLDVGTRQEFDELPCRVFARRVAEQHQAGAAGNARPRPIRARQRCGAPRILEFRRRTLAEFADIPGAGHIEREHAVEEFIPDVGDLGFRHRRGKVLLEHSHIETERFAESRAVEIAAAIDQQRIVLLQRQRQQLFELVQRQQHRIAVLAALTLDRRHRRLPFRPGLRRLVVTGSGQQILAIEQQPRIHVPRHAVDVAIDDIGVPDAFEVILLFDHGRVVDVGLQRLKRVQLRKFRHPGVAQLADVRQRISGIGRQQFFVRRGPGNLLQFHAQRGMLALELRNQCADHFGLAPHRPETDRHAVVGRTAGRQQKQAA